MKKRNSNTIAILSLFTFVLVGGSLIKHVFRHYLAKQEREMVVEMKKNALKDAMTKWFVIELKAQSLILQNRLGDYDQSIQVLPDPRLDPDYIWAELHRADETYRQTLQQNAESSLFIILLHRIMLDPERSLSPEQLEELNRQPENQAHTCSRVADSLKNLLLLPYRTGVDHANTATWSSLTKEELDYLRRKGHIHYN